jgi:hypothetical protein
MFIFVKKDWNKHPFLCLLIPSVRSADVGQHVVLPVKQELLRRHRSTRSLVRRGSIVPSEQSTLSYIYFAPKIERHSQTTHTLLIHAKERDQRSLRSPVLSAELRLVQFVR